jgi:undecaprenyl-diphosphatase
LTVFKSILLGIVQGVAEFLPISSSGHLVILQTVFGFEDIEANYMLFDALLHLGTLIAVVIVYYRDIKAMILEFVGFFRELRDPALKQEQVSPKRRLLLLVIIATLPLVFAVFLNNIFEKLFNSLISVGFALLITGCILFLADTIRRGKKTERNASVWDALIVGLCQLIGVVPGISRSGITISAGMFCGFDREFAVRFSFLMSIPAIIGANAYTLIKALASGAEKIEPGIYLAGIITAAVFGFAAIKLVQYIVKKNRFGGFAYYCWIIGAITVIVSFII